MAKTTNKTKAKNTAKKTTGKYKEGIGRRKTAVARVRLTKGSGKYTANDKDIVDYFQMKDLADIALAPLSKLGMEKEYDVSAKINGSGIHAQAEAVRLGVARALVEFDAELKKKLRAFGFMTRDPRMVERKKPGLVKARKRKQWSKR